MSYERYTTRSKLEIKASSVTAINPEEKKVYQNCLPGKEQCSLQTALALFCLQGSGQI